MSSCCRTFAASIRAVGTYNEQLLAIAGKQHQIVSRTQLLEIGTRKQIDYRLQSGVLQQVLRSVYRLGGSPETWRQKLMAATFAGGKLSVASFQAAAALEYLPGGAGVVEITSPRHRHARHIGVHPHESRFLTDLDVMYIDSVE